MSNESEGDDEAKAKCVFSIGRKTGLAEWLGSCKTTQVVVEFLASTIRPVAVVVIIIIVIITDLHRISGECNNK